MVESRLDHPPEHVAELGVSGDPVALANDRVDVHQLVVVGKEVEAVEVATQRLTSTFVQKQVLEDRLHTVPTKKINIMNIISYSFNIYSLCICVEILRLRDANAEKQ